MLLYSHDRYIDKMLQRYLKHYFIHVWWGGEKEEEKRGWDFFFFFFRLERQSMKYNSFSLFYLRHILSIFDHEKHVS